MDYQEDVCRLDEHDFEFHAPVVGADPGDALALFDGLGGVHDVQRVGFADPVFAATSGESDQLLFSIVSDIKRKCKTQMVLLSDGSVPRLRGHRGGPPKNAGMSRLCTPTLLVSGAMLL